MVEAELHEIAQRVSAHGGTITEAQTTYLVVSSPGLSMPIRVDYHGKLEADLKSGPVRHLSFHSSHPLLLDLGEPTFDLYFSRPPKNAQALLDDLNAAVTTLYGSWRTLPRYLNEHSAPIELLEGGHGVLLHGPRSLIELVVPLARAAGISPNPRPCRAQGLKLHLLLADRHFVTAEGFSVRDTSRTDRA